MIVDGATRLAHAVGLKPVIEDDLLEENVFLVEKPHLLRGSFPESYLRLPAPVLMSAMKKHEKFFPSWTRRGTSRPVLSPFTTTATPTRCARATEWVLIARFNDAEAFFFEEDLKRPLARIRAHAGANAVPAESWARSWIRPIGWSA